MADARKIIVGAVAAAATAGLVTVGARKLGKSAAVFHVTALDGDWIVRAEGAKRASSRHETKREAVVAGRELAGLRTPSRLVIHRSDGEIQRSHDYQAADSRPER